MSKQVYNASSGGVPVPPPDPRPYVPHICLPSAGETNFLALHPRVMGFMMHWVDKQHVPHVQHREWCSGCRAGVSARWEGFLGVLSINTLNRYVLRVPAAAFRESGMFREKSDQGLLEGTVFTAYRFGKVPAPNNPARIQLVEQLVPMPRVKPFSLTGALSKYWKRENLNDLVPIADPTEAQKRLAEEFAEIAKRLKNEQAARKGGKP